MAIGKEDREKIMKMVEEITKIYDNREFSEMDIDDEDLDNAMNDLDHGLSDLRSICQKEE